MKKKDTKIKGFSWKEFFNLKDSLKIYLFLFLIIVWSRTYFIKEMYKTDILFIKIGYPIFIILSAFIMASLFTEIGRHFEELRLIRKNKKNIDLEIKKRHNEHAFVGFISLIFFSTTIILTNFKWFYSFIALIIGMIVGRIILRLVRKKK